MQQLITAPTIYIGLSELGVRKGMTLLVHCSLSSFGRVQGGAQAVLEALIDCVGDEGTIVMPAFTDGRFDPSEWGNPPAREEDWHRIRFETPLYHPNKTPVEQSMSSVYELFRTWPDVARTIHPHSSFSAWGKHQSDIVADHKLEDRFGESSPLSKLYDLNAQVLFLGTTYKTNTCFHLAEYRQPGLPMRECMIVREVDGVKKLVRYVDVDTDSSIFEKIGVAFEAKNNVRRCHIGGAVCRLFELRQAVDFAQMWLQHDRIRT